MGKDGKNLLYAIYFTSRPSPLLSLGNGGGGGWGGEQTSAEHGRAEGAGRGGEGKGGGYARKEEGERGQTGWLAAQRENTVEAQSEGSRLVRDAEGGGRGAAFN